MLFRSLLLGIALVSPLIAADKSPLANAPTAFVRAQAASAVRWQPWTDAVLAQAKQQAKPVYVFVGVPLSELTRATLNQTFTNEKTVTWLNENFFCIFVDADAQPEVAAYAQHFINTVKQLRGSPVHLWLTPDLQAYDGANYLPPSEEWGKPGFLKAARSALDTWAQPARARALATEAMGMMTLPALDTETFKPDLPARLDQAATAWLAAADEQHGGFGSAPKQPEPELIRFLLHRGPAAQAAALRAARALVDGAVRDPVDGGFYRRAIDEGWKEPYYQKTLADQARIALALFEAAEVAPDDRLRVAAEGALDFALRELRQPDGSWAAGLDGTGEEASDPAKRPHFVPIGTASTGVQGLLIVALQRSGQERFLAAAKEIAGKLRQRRDALPHIVGLPAAGTPFDHVAVALAFRSLKEEAAAERLLARATEWYFDSKAGVFLISPVKPPEGLAMRAPAGGDVPSAETLALLAGIEEKTAATLAHAMLLTIQYDDQPAGDILLGLGATRRAAP